MTVEKSHKPTSILNQHNTSVWVGLKTSKRTKLLFCDRNHYFGIHLSIYLCVCRVNVGALVLDLSWNNEMKNA